MTNSGNDKQAYILGSIFALSNRLQTLGDKLPDYMTIKQWFLIAVISKSENNTLTIGQLATIIGSSHQNIKKMAISLQKQGFLTLNKNPSDARSVVISLTEHCIDYFKQRSHIEEMFLNAVFQDFGEEYIDGLYDGMQLLQGNVERMEAIQKQESNVEG
jgi:DNA-binding MarR family transcriptional regulator